MARSKSSPTGLDASEVEQLRTRLAGGGRPRVRLSGSQFAPDATGTVLRVGDPTVDGEDYIIVRARVAGVVDELAFAPSELVGTGRASTPAPSVAKTARPRASKAIAIDAPAKAVAPTKAEAPTKAVAPAKVDAPAKAEPVRRRRPVVTPPVTMTIKSTGSTWTVSVQRGTRAVVKNATVVPGAVTAIAALLDDPATQEAVAAINDTARGAAEDRAAQLRAELAQVQAVLDSHRRR